MEPKFTIDDWHDSKWRLCNIYKITDKAGQTIPFRPNTAQIKFLDDVHSKNIILKARQLGFTTFCCLIYLDACLFNENVRAGVIAHKLDDAKVIFRDKVKFPFDKLMEDYPLLSEKFTARQDSTDTLTLANGSSIRVSTSMRSGTLQYLHISEYGKLCAQFPERAREVKTGALNAVAAGQFVVIESTAEGQEGDFYETSQTSKALRDAKADLTSMDYKFHFYPWYEEANYKLEPPEDWKPPEEYRKYFAKLHFENKVKTTPEQQFWYVKKATEMGSDMKREYPSTPAEAFEQALEGTYFAKELEIATKQGRIGSFPIVRSEPVNTFWDLGRNDFNVIWLHQYVKNKHRFIGYYENSGEYIGHYVSWLKDWASENGVTFGDHYWPHDGKREDLFLEDGRLGVAEKLGFRPEIVERPASKIDSISKARTIFGECDFDETGCDQGLKRLRMYRKEWDELRGVWKDKPRHDDASHGADGFQTFACSDFTPDTYVMDEVDTEWVV